MGWPRETEKDHTDEVLAPTVDVERSPERRGSHLRAGAILGEQYRVVRRLGQGGMGTVYVVEHTELGRRFAAKVVSSELSDTALERLMNEARVTSGIDHQNIVDVVNLGRDEDGSVFVIMELLEGEDLAQRLMRQLEDHPDAPWLPDEELQRYVPEILSGLQAAHDAGVIHRDLKPENIFLAERPDGLVTVKLLDFGIAKNAQPEGNHRLTRTGQIIGTPLYMAPEQARSMSDADNRADIYSVGVILYEMVTGGPPFDADTLFDLIIQHATLPPKRPRDRRPDLPEPVEDVVLRCLHKKREHRFSNVGELRKAWDDAWQGIPLAPLDVSREELERPLSAERSIPAEVSSAPIAALTSSAPRAPIFVGVALLALLVGGGAAWLFAQAPPDPSPAPIAAPVPDPEHEPEIEVVEPAPPELAATVRLLQSDPQGATVTQDGERLGTTPLTVSVPQGGTIDVEISLSGYLPTTATIDGASTDRVEVELDRGSPGRGHRHRRGTPAQTQTAASAPEQTPATNPGTPTPSGGGMLLGMDDFDSERRR